MLTSGAGGSLKTRSIEAYLLRTWVPPEAPTLRITLIASASLFVIYIRAPCGEKGKKEIKLKNEV